MQHQHQSFRTQYNNNNNNNQHNKIFPTFQEKMRARNKLQRTVRAMQKNDRALNFTFKFILIYRCENRQRFCC